jgi:Zn-dependent M28 family amino/carboxypeptidase
VGQQISLTLTARGAAKLLEGSGHTLEDLQKAARANEPLPAAFDLKGTLHAKSSVKREAFTAPNVVGVLPGSDKKLKNEYVIMSAHLDHLGISARPVNGDTIFNGAMDDASGVASVIEIARVMASSKVKLKRSVIFLTVAGEEKGELGSHYFAAHPTVPRSAIVADINLDMFLPLYPLKVIEVQGLTESSLGREIRLAAESLGVQVQPDQEPEQNRFIRSDQYSFIKEGIPSLAFKFGYEKGSPDETTRRNWVRDVYHKVNDDLNQPVDKEAAAKFDRVIASLLERVANNPARPTWNEDSFFRRFAKTE